jgi:hypothetical protein
MASNLEVKIRVEPLNKFELIKGDLHYTADILLSQYILGEFSFDLDLEPLGGKKC